MAGLSGPYRVGSRMVKNPACLGAAHAIETYTRPCNMVPDPMSGIGTALVEALHRSRRALGRV